MPKLTYTCPICEKQLKLKREFTLGATRLFEYTCGHIFSKSFEEIHKSDLDFTSNDGSHHKARPYQEDGVKFILESDFNCIIGDQMRLGKTPQALLALKNKLSERTPALILVKGANLWQWIREFRKWTTMLPNGIYPVVGSQGWIPPGFSAYIMSMDTFAIQSKCKCGCSYHEDDCKRCKKNGRSCRVYQPAGESVVDKLKKIPFKLIIADEAHSFKNTDSNRSQALVDFVAFLNIGEEDTSLNFECNRCGHKWFEKGIRKFDKRIGHTVISESSRCEKCWQYVYQQQQHDSREKWRSNPEASERITKLLALGCDQSTTEPERQLALTKAVAMKDEYNIKLKEDKPCGLVLLTGTPILNRASEYFVPLNLVNPEKFSSFDRFCREWLIQTPGKSTYDRVHPLKLQAFKQTIAPYILRREKEDVYTELPKLNKIYTLIEPDKTALASQYNKILDKLEVKLADKIKLSFQDASSEIMELRRICGMMKLMWTADYLESCTLEEGPREKYAIGIHHQSVRDVLYLKLGGETNCLKLSGEDSPEKKDQIMRNWEHAKQQFLVINMLAGGVGMDFHYCDNVLVLERMWNSEMESQFEFRFYNPDMSIKKNPTNVEYIIAKGTLDEWWFDMVEQKRQVVGETVYNNWDLQSDSQSFRDLVEKTVAARL